MRALAIGLVIALALPAAPAAWAGPADPAALLAQGEEQLGRGQFRPAARTFTQAYRAQPRALRAGEAGEHVVGIAVDAYMSAWRAAESVEDLESARALLQEYLNDVAAAHPDGKPELTKSAEAKLVELEELLAQREQSAEPTAPNPEPDPPNDGPPQPVPEHKPQPLDATRDAAPRGIDKVGIALTVTGGLVVITGVALPIHGARLENQAKDTIDDRGGVMSDEDQDWLNDAETLNRNLAISGGVLIGVGLVPLVWGIVHLARWNKRGPKKSAWIPRVHVHADGQSGVVSLGWGMLRGR